MAELLVSMVVAMARDNRVIGKDNDLPWRLPSDLKHFKAVTMGKPLVMGRKTFDSIGKPLPGRANLVVTRDPNWRAEGVEVFGSVEAALTAAKRHAEETGAGEVCIIGGAQIYEAALPLVDVIHLTEVWGDVEGDTFFPALNPGEWRATERRDLPPHAEATHNARYVKLERRG